MCKRTLVLVVACLMFLAGSASQSPASNGRLDLRVPGTRAPGVAHTRQRAGRPVEPSLNALAERFRGKLAEIAIVRDIGDSRDLREAILWLQRNIRLMQRLHFAKAAASGHLLAGELYSVLSRFDMAVVSYGQALRLSPKGSYLRCSSMSHLARVYATIGHLQSALGYSQRALESSQDLDCWAEALQAQGEALYYSNSHDDLNRSLELSLLAADVFAQLGDINRQAQALLNAAYSTFQLSGSQDGFRLAESALRLWSSSGNQHGAALAHTALGYFSIRTGNPEHSRSEYRQALQVLTEMGDEDNEAIVYSGLGLLVQEIGNTDEAYEDFERARLLFAGARDLIGEAGAIGSKAAIIRRRRNYREAKRLYHDELALTRRARHSRLEAAVYVDLAGVFDAEGNLQQAIAYCQKALQLDQNIHHNYGAGESWRCLGRLYGKQQRDKDALIALNQALAFKDAAQAAPEQAAVHHEIASVYRRLGQLELARLEVEQAIQLIESERIKFSGFDDRASYFSSVHEYYELYVEVLMELHERHPEQNFAQQAFEAWEKSKMRSLLDMLASNRNMDCAPQANASNSNSGKTVTASAPEVSKDEPGCSTSDALALPLGEIQQLIRGDDSLIVEYALGSRNGYVWVVSDQNMWSYKIPNRNEMSVLVEGLQKALLARIDRSHEGKAYAPWVRQADKEYVHHSQALAQALLGPISHLLESDKKRIIVVADGPLQHLAFAALPLHEVGGQTVLLRDQHELVHLPSASVLKFIRDAAKHRPSPTMQAAVFANPVFSRDDLQVSSAETVKPKPEYSWDLRGALRDMHLDHERLPRLPGTAAEAEAVVDIMGSDQVFVATGPKATREAVLNGNLERYRHVLFATHSLLDEQRPELSGLVLSLVNEAGEKLDGYLRMKDIYHLNLSAETVVLSSCESALGKDLHSEGMIGLTRAFLYAGSKRVVSSLWKVDDGATAELVKHLYQWIQDGKAPGEALRLAQADLSKNPQWRHPYYWAGFILQGEYRPIESQH